MYKGVYLTTVNTLTSLAVRDSHLKRGKDRRVGFEMNLKLMRIFKGSCNDNSIGIDMTSSFVTELLDPRSLNTQDPFILAREDLCASIGAELSPSEPVLLEQIARCFDTIIPPLCQARETKYVNVMTEIFQQEISRQRDARTQEVKKLNAECDHLRSRLERRQQELNFQRKNYYKEILLLRESVTKRRTDPKTLQALDEIITSSVLLVPEMQQQEGSSSGRIEEEDTGPKPSLKTTKSFMATLLNPKKIMDNLHSAMDKIETLKQEVEARKKYGEKSRMEKQKWEERAQECQQELEKCQKSLEFSKAQGAQHRASSVERPQPEENAWWKTGHRGGTELVSDIQQALADGELSIDAFCNAAIELLVPSEIWSHCLEKLDDDDASEKQQTSKSGWTIWQTRVQKLKQQWHEEQLKTLVPKDQRSDVSLKKQDAQLKAQLKQVLQQNLAYKAELKEHQDQLYQARAEFKRSKDHVVMLQQNIELLTAQAAEKAKSLKSEQHPQSSKSSKSQPLKRKKVHQACQTTTSFSNSETIVGEEQLITLQREKIELKQELKVATETLALSERDCRAKEEAMEVMDETLNTHARQISVLLQTADAKERMLKREVGSYKQKLLTLQQLYNQKQEQVGDMSKSKTRDDDEVRYEERLKELEEAARQAQVEFEALELEIQKKKDELHLAPPELVENTTSAHSPGSNMIDKVHNSTKEEPLVDKQLPPNESETFVTVERDIEKNEGKTNAVTEEAQEQWTLEKRMYLSRIATLTLNVSKLSSSMKAITSRSDTEIQFWKHQSESLTNQTQELELTVDHLKMELSLQEERKNVSNVLEEFMTSRKRASSILVTPKHLNPTSAILSEEEEEEEEASFSPSIPQNTVEAIEGLQLVVQKYIHPRKANVREHAQSLLSYLLAKFFNQRGVSETSPDDRRTSAFKQRMDDRLLQNSKKNNSRKLAPSEAKPEPNPPATLDERSAGSSCGSTPEPITNDRDLAKEPSAENLRLTPELEQCMKVDMDIENEFNLPKPESDTTTYTIVQEAPIPESEFKPAPDLPKGMPDRSLMFDPAPDGRTKEKQDDEDDRFRMNCYAQSILDTEIEHTRESSRGSSTSSWSSSSSRRLSYEHHPPQSLMSSSSFAAAAVAGPSSRTSSTPSREIQTPESTTSQRSVISQNPNKISIESTLYFSVRRLAQVYVKVTAKLRGLLWSRLIVRMKFERQQERLDQFVAEHEILSREYNAKGAVVPNEWTILCQKMHQLVHQLGLTSDALLEEVEYYRQEKRDLLLSVSWVTNIQIFRYSDIHEYHFRSIDDTTHVSTRVGIDRRGEKFRTASEGI